MASICLPRTPPFSLISEMAISSTSFNDVSLIAIVPVSECRMPTLIVLPSPVPPLLALPLGAQPDSTNGDKAEPAASRRLVLPAFFRMSRRVSVLRGDSEPGFLKAVLLICVRTMSLREDRAYDWGSQRQSKCQVGAMRCAFIIRVLAFCGQGRGDSHLSALSRVR